MGTKKITDNSIGNSVYYECSSFTPLKHQHPQYFILFPFFIITFLKQEVIKFPESGADDIDLASKNSGSHWLSPTTS